MRAAHASFFSRATPRAGREQISGEPHHRWSSSHISGDSNDRLSGAPRRAASDLAALPVPGYPRVSTADPPTRDAYLPSGAFTSIRDSPIPTPPSCVFVFPSNNRLTQRSRTVRPRSVASKARASVRVGAVAAARPTFFPGTTPPKHLDGTMPGDYGFDPLGLGEDKVALEWYKQAELQHARWAMLGVTGMAAPELIQNPFVEGAMPNWAEAPLWDGYMASPNTLFVVQMFMMNWAEVRRWQDMKNPGTMNEDPLTGANKGDTNTDVGYPKGLFDPMGMAKDPEKVKVLKVKEIANGRLAMVAVMGCIIQNEATGVGPIANLKAHLADPAHNTIFTNFVPIQF